jgi:hypothetical protein
MLSGDAYLFTYQTNTGRYDLISSNGPCNVKRSVDTVNQLLFAAALF